MAGERPGDTKRVHKTARQALSEKKTPLANPETRWPALTHMVLEHPALLSLRRWALASFSLKVLIGLTLGAAAGYGWYRLVGCRTGTCLITSRWWTSTAYGALMGFFAARS